MGVEGKVETMEGKRHHKPPRLPGYDYSAPGYYFVTFNTRFRGQDILAQTVRPDDMTVGTAAFGGPVLPLTSAGKMVERLIENIDHVYPDVHVDCYAIMPDHVHLLLALGHWENRDGPPRGAAPTPLFRVINTLKSLASKQCGYPLWQDEYYDHIIRNDADLFETRKYIQGNPLKQKEVLSK